MSATPILVYNRFIRFGDTSIYRENFGDIITIYRYGFFSYPPTLDVLLNVL